MTQIVLLFIILLLVLVLFIWGKWRYDIVALTGLLLAVIVGIVPYESAFSGLGNPAVITVACVMIITFAINQSGILDFFIKRLTPVTHHYVMHLGILTFITAVLSAFMNNVGALALMMPIAIQTSLKAKRSPSLVLMPLAFGSVLGGLVTSIGTPPNLLISAYREQLVGQSFSMFDFSPVGLVAAVVGILFIILLGWRLLPLRKATTRTGDLFQIQDYITEIKVPKGSQLIGKSLKELEEIIEAEYFVVGLIRQKKKKLAIRREELLQANDILIIEASHTELEKLIHKSKFELVTGDKVSSDILRSETIGLIEAVVPQGSRFEGRSSNSLRLRQRYHLNIIAIARQGKPFKQRLSHVNLHAGDVVLIQGNVESLQDNISRLGLLPLVERGVQVGLPKRAYGPTLIFLFAIFLAGFQVLPVPICFAIAVIMMVIFNMLPVRRMYDAIDLPIILLLAAMIPLGNALQTTGATHLIASALDTLTGRSHPYIILGVIFIITMTLSDLMNNAATAVVMAPVAAAVAQSMNLNLDPFLMTVAVAASCSFLTPISHQNNTLVMGPGGYKFFDYFRMGLPLEIIILVVSIPMIAWVWPLQG